MHRPLEEVLVNPAPIGIMSLLCAGDGVLAYSHSSLTQRLILLGPPCHAFIPSALRQLDIVAGFNIVHKLAVVILPTLLLLAFLVLAVFVLAVVRAMATVVKRERATNNIIHGVLVQHIAHITNCTTINAQLKLSTTSLMHNSKWR